MGGKVGSSVGTFPFGRPVRATKPKAKGLRKVFVLGAYSSALHVHWRPPPTSKKRGIIALAVDVEPEPFWNGLDGPHRVERWKKAVDFTERVHGSVAAATANGDSGRALDAHYLDALGVERSDCWITDCLDTYRLSEDGRKAIDGRFIPWATANGFDLPLLSRHPSESAIVKEALRDHRDRLAAELAESQPELIITLGNAAIRVLQGVLDAKESPGYVDADEYGRPREVDVLGIRTEWLALAHPGAINRSAKWRKAHAQWATLQRHARRRGGRLYQRVVVSGATRAWPAGTPQHRVDAVHFPDHPVPGVFDWEDHAEQFADDMSLHRAVVMTARSFHDRPLLGVLVGGREFLSRSYPDHHRISCAALTDEPEANIDWVYRRNDIRVIVKGEPWD